MGIPVSVVYIFLPTGILDMLLPPFLFQDIWLHFFCTIIAVLD